MPEREIRRRPTGHEPHLPPQPLEGTELIVRIRKRMSLDDITGLGSHGGDAVQSKKALRR